MKKKCKDNRCLYLAKDKKQLKCNFSTLTNLTREGPGIWEKCNNCGLSINRSGVKKKDFEVILKLINQKTKIKIG